MFQVERNSKDTMESTHCAHKQQPLIQEESSVNVRCFLLCFFFPSVALVFHFSHFFFLLKVWTSSHLKLWFCPPSYECNCEDSIRYAYLRLDFFSLSICRFVDQLLQERKTFHVVVFDYLKLLYIPEYIYISTCSACQSISGRTPSMTIYEFSWEVSSTSQSWISKQEQKGWLFFFTIQGTEQSPPVSTCGSPLQLHGLLLLAVVLSVESCWFSLPDHPNSPVLYTFWEQVSQRWPRPHYWERARDLL